MEVEEQRAQNAMLQPSQLHGSVGVSLEPYMVGVQVHERERAVCKVCRRLG